MPIKKGDRLQHQMQKTFGTALDDEQGNAVPVRLDSNGSTTMWVAADCDVVPANQGVCITVGSEGEEISITAADGSAVRFYYDKTDDCFYEGAKSVGQKFSSAKGRITQATLPDLYKWLKAKLKQ